MIIKPLTDRERDTLNYIIQYQTDHGYSPTYREIGRGIQTNSVKSVQTFLEALQDKGYIKIGEKICRSIVVITEVRK